MEKQEKSRAGLLKIIEALELENGSLKRLLQKQDKESKETERALRLSEEKIPSSGRFVSRNDILDR